MVFPQKGPTYRRPSADPLRNYSSDFHYSPSTADEHVEIFPQFSSDWLPSGGLQLRWSDVSAGLRTKSSDDPMVPILREIFQNSLVMHKFSSVFCWAESNLPLLADLSWPIQAHAATFALIPYYNVPDPLTGEEDATKPSKTFRKIAPWAWTSI